MFLICVRKIYLAKNPIQTNKSLKFKVTNYLFQPSTSHQINETEEISPNQVIEKNLSVPLRYFIILFKNDLKKRFVFF